MPAIPPVTPYNTPYNSHSIAFESITPDKYNDWLNQSDSDFEAMLPLANRQTKLAKDTADEEAIFGLYSLGVSTNRDEWVYDFDPDNLGRKVRAFIHGYEEIRALHGGKHTATVDLGNSIKWTRDLERQLRLDISNVFNRTSIRQAESRPFVHKVLYFNRQLNEMQYQMPQVFPTGATNENKVICFPGNTSSNCFQVLATDRVFSHDLLKTTQCLPLYRYAGDGDRVSNITEWGLRRFREHYGDDDITDEDIFAYVYAMLHDPAYRQCYEVDLRRDFPRVYFQEDFAWWAQQGRALLDMHLGFETAETWPLERVDNEGVTPKRAILRVDKERNVITLDEQTTLAGVPAEAWKYHLGSRSALEWVLPVQGA